MANQQGDIFTPVPERGQMNRKYRQPVKQILPEIVFRNHLLYVLICSSNDPDINNPGMCFTQGFYLIFLKDPEKYFAKFEKEGIQLENIQATCPVSGEKLGEGDMGEPVAISYKGRTIMFCCNMCPPKFEQDPAKYLAKLPGEQPASK